jgi:hypothetical protein
MANHAWNFTKVNEEIWKVGLQVIHNHPLYLVCSDVLLAVGETSYGIWVGFM